MLGYYKPENFDQNLLKTLGITQHISLIEEGFEECEKIQEVVYIGEYESMSEFKQRLDKITDPAELKNLVKEYRENQKPIEQARRRKLIWDWLEKSNNIDRLKDTAESEYERELWEALKNRVENQKSLGFMYADQLKNFLGILNELKDLLIIANRKVPNKTEYKVYKNFFDINLTAINKKIKQIQQTVMARLELAEEHCNIEYSDQVHGIYNQLEKIQKFRTKEQNINLTVNMKIDRPQTMTATEFNGMHEIVIASKDSELIDKLDNLSWFKTKAENRGDEFKKNQEDRSLGNMMANTFGLNNKIPSKKKSPDWLFKGNNTRFEIFNNIAGFANLRLKEKQLEKIINQSNTEPLIDIAELLKSLQQYQAAYEAILENLESEFRKLNNHFFWSLTTSSTQELLVDFKKAMINTMVDKLKAMDGKIAQCLAKVLNYKQDEEKFTLINMVNSFRDHPMCQGELTKKQLESFNEYLKTSKENTQQRHLETLFQPLENQKSNNPADFSNVQLIVEEYKLVKCNQSEYTVKFIERLNKVNKEFLDNLKKSETLNLSELNLETFDLKAFENQMHYIKNLAFLLVNTGNIEQRKIVDGHIKKLIFKYLKLQSINSPLKNLDSNSRGIITNNVEEILRKVADKSQNVDEINRLIEGRSELLQKDNSLFRLNEWAAINLRPYEDEEREDTIRNYISVVKSNLENWFKGQKDVCADRWDDLEKISQSLISLEKYNVYELSDQVGLEDLEKSLLGLGKYKSNRFFERKDYELQKTHINIVAALIKISLMSESLNSKNNNKLFVLLKSAAETSKDNVLKKVLSWEINMPKVTQVKNNTI